MVDIDITSTFGGITFTNAESASYTVATMDGWYSGAPVRSVVEDRPNADGAFGTTRVYKSSRVVTQTGLILADSPASDEWTAFAAIQSDGRPSDFTVVDSSGTKTLLDATLAAEPEIVPIVGGLASYTMQVVARDPVKYGTAQVAATGLPSAGGGLEYPLHSPSGALYYGALGALGRLTLTNSGTAETWPSFLVTGELTTGFFIQNLDTGDVLRYDRVVPAGSTVSIDCRTGEVLVDDASDASTYLTRDEFFSVPAGGSVTVQFNAISSSSGTPTMTATYRSGWW